jgi:hypothetical protein
MQPSDAGVDVGSLIMVDPAGRDLFGQPVGNDAASPAFLQEVGVVVWAEQGQVGDSRVVAPIQWPYRRARQEVRSTETGPRRDGAARRHAASDHDPLAAAFHRGCAHTLSKYRE